MLDQFFGGRTVLSRLFIVALFGFGFTPASIGQTKYDWLQNGGDPQKDNWNRSETILNTSNVSGLTLLWQAKFKNSGLTPVYLSDVTTPLGIHDIIFNQENGGTVTGYDAHTGAVLWTNGLNGSGGSGPAIDPNRLYIYVIGGGYIHRLKVGDGTEVTGDGFPARAATRKERTPPELAIFTAKNGHTYVYAESTISPNAHIVAANLADGSEHVFNLANSAVTGFSTNGPGGANVWGPIGVTYSPDTDLIYCSTSEGKPNFTTKWSESMVAIKPDGTSSAPDGLPMDSFTPTNYEYIVKKDRDLCSANMMVLPPIPGSSVPHLGVLSGKSAEVWLVNLANMSGMGGAGHIGGEIDHLDLPQGRGSLGSTGTPGLWINPADKGIWLFYQAGGIAGLKLMADSSGHVTMQTQWFNTNGTVGIPHVANGVLYYNTGANQSHGAGTLYAANPLTGATLWSHPLGKCHWEGPIVDNGVLYMADQGTLSAFGLNGPIRAAAPVPSPGGG